MFNLKRAEGRSLNYFYRYWQVHQNKNSGSSVYRLDDINIYINVHKRSVGVGVLVKMIDIEIWKDGVELATYKARLSQNNLDQELINFKDQ